MQHINKICLLIIGIILIIPLASATPSVSYYKNYIPTNASTNLTIHSGSIEESYDNDTLTYVRFSGNENGWVIYDFIRGPVKGFNAYTFLFDDFAENYFSTIEIYNGSWVIDQENVTIPDTSWTYINFTKEYIDVTKIRLQVVELIDRPRIYELNIYKGNPLFSPDPVYSAGNLSCIVNYTNTNTSLNGTLYFKWYIDGSNVFNETVNNVIHGNLANSTLNNSYITGGNLVNCTVYADDGQDNSTLNEGHITISNTAPINTYNYPQDGAISVGKAELSRIIPLNITVTDDDSDESNVTLYQCPDDQCYQESVNESNQTGIDGNCNFLYDGVYSHSGFWRASADAPKAFDGDWNTYADCSTNGNGVGNLYINYTFPPNALIEGTVWEIKTGSWHENLSFMNFQSCWDYSNTTLQLYIYARNNNNNWFSAVVYCWNGSDWQYMRPEAYNDDSSIDDIYEEAMHWFVGTELNSTDNLASGSDYVWNWSVDEDVTYYWRTKLYDGQDYGFPAAVSFTTYATIDFTPMIIAPDPTYSNLSVSVNTTYIHIPGNDSNITFRWYVNGINVWNQTNNSISNGTTLFSTLSYSNYTQSDKINVSVTGVDVNGHNRTEWSNTLRVYNLAPWLVLNSPADGALNQLTSVLLNVTAIDVDGDPTDVSFYSYPSTHCYQESANISNITGIDGASACNLNYSGTYYLHPMNRWCWVPPCPSENLKTYDGNWTTYDAPTSNAEGQAIFDVNYTKPENATSLTKWEFKHGKNVTSQVHMNISFEDHEDCWNFSNDILSLRIIVQNLNNQYYYASAWCYNGSWKNLTYEYTQNSETAKMYEEAIHWDLGTLLNISENVSNGADVSWLWTGRRMSKTYFWQARVTDNQDEIRTSIYNFTIFSIPNVTLNYPADGATDIELSPILNVTVTDPSNQIMNVSFLEVVNFTLEGISPEGPYGSGGGWGLAVDDKYVYAGGEHSCYMQIYNKSTLMLDSTLQYSPAGPFPQISDIVIVDDILIVGGLCRHDASNWPAVVYNRTTLTEIAEMNASYSILDIEVDSDYIYLGTNGQGTDVFHRGNYSYFTNIATPATVYDTTVDEDNGLIYMATFNGLFNVLYRNNFSVKQTLNQSGGAYTTSAVFDDDYIYTSHLDNFTDVFHRGNLSRKETLAGWPGYYSYYIEQDDYYLYYPTMHLSDYGRVIVVRKSDMTVQYILDSQGSQDSNSRFVRVIKDPYGDYIYAVGYNDTVHKWEGGLSLLNTSENVANGSDATYLWSVLDTDTTYGWSTVVTNGDDTLYGPIWNFTTKEAPVISWVNVTPTTVYTKDDLTATTIAIDKYNTSIDFYFKWYVNGVNVWSQTNLSIGNNTQLTSTIDSTYYSRTDDVNCSVAVVVPEGDERNSTIVWSNTVTILNSNPNATSTDVNTTWLAMNSTVKINTSVIDDDGNNTVNSVTAEIMYPDTSQVNVSLSRVLNGIITSPDQEAGTQQITGAAAASTLQCTVNGSASSSSVSCSNNNACDEDATDATYDSCTDSNCGAGGPGTIVVRDIYAPSSAPPGATINVTCEIYAYDAMDTTNLAYNNGTGWRIIGSQASAGTGAYNYTFQVTIDNTANATHYVRCLEWSAYGGGSATDTCGTSAYSDADDMAITIAAPTYIDYSNVNFNSSSSILTFIVDVSAYSGTSDMTIEIYDGSSWVSVGNLGISGTGNASISTTNVTQIAAWEDNRDFRVNGGTISVGDSISWTGAWIRSRNWESPLYYYIWNDTAVPGTYNITQISVQDIHGGSSTSQPNLFFEVNGPPIINLNSPSNGATGLELSQVLNVTVTDPNADNMNVTIYRTPQASKTTDNDGFNALSGAWELCTHLDAFPYSSKLNITFDVEYTGGQAVIPYASVRIRDSDFTLLEELNDTNKDKNEVTTNYYDGATWICIANFNESIISRIYVEDVANGYTNCNDTMKLVSGSRQVSDGPYLSVRNIQETLNLDNNLPNGSDSTYLLASIPPGHTIGWWAVATDAVLTTTSPVWSFRTSYEPVINTYESVPASPEYGNETYLKINITDLDSDNINYCNFTIIGANGTTVLDNVNGTKAAEIWTSDDFNMTYGYGKYNYSVTCTDRINQVTQEWSYKLSLGELYLNPPIDWIFALQTGLSKTRDFEITHNGTSRNSVVMGTEGQLSNKSLFSDITLSNFTIDVNNEYNLTVNITANATAPTGTYTGNLTFTRSEDGTIYRIPIVASLSTSAAYIDISVDPTSKTTIMYEDEYIDWYLTVSNNGNYPATHCNATAIGDIVPFTLFSDGAEIPDDFTVEINESTLIVVSYEEPPIGAYLTGVITVKCQATPEGGQDTATVSPITIVVLPTQEAQNIGGASTVIERNITQPGVECGNNVCESGETAFSCPEDCTGLGPFGLANVEQSVVLKVMLGLLVGGVAYSYYISQMKVKRKYKKRKKSFDWGDFKW